MINFGVLAEYLFIALSIAGLLWLRKKRPDLSRPIKVSLFYPYSFLIVCLFIILVTFVQIPLESFICLGIIGSGIPIYIIGVKWQKPKPIQDKLGKLKNIIDF